LIYNYFAFSIHIQHFTTVAKAIDLLDSSQLSEYSPNYCNNSELVENAGLIRSTLGQFLGFECSAEFYHCRWQSDGFRTYKKLCRPGLVYDTLGTQNCNYDYNVKGYACTSEQFLCPLSEICVNMSQRCDGKYDCALEEDEQNCPICQPNFFPCVASEQCIPMTRRCDGFADCSDGTDEMNCEACPTGWFFCKKSKQCIKGSERCDGIEQCHTGEDEALCKFPKDQEFICEDRNHKIPIAQFCDGIEQCPDRSDEFYYQIQQQIDEMPFHKTSSNLLFPQNHVLSSGVQKIMPQKIKPATMLTVAEPKVEVAHSVDYFPFLKSLTLQKASNVPQAAKLSDMTLKKTKNHSLSKSHFLTTPKQEKITLKEITVPLQQNIPTTTEILETVKQTKSRNIKFLKTTSLSPHPFAASQVQKQKQSTTRKPESTTFETPEAEILHRIGSHFKTNKSGKTLSTK
uniref:Chitin-binding type-2 domain-containing protein n=1 Tax=Syphacia muris TaxID=451379 RepID=A0A0N5ALW6_9BILA